MLMEFYKEQYPLLHAPDDLAKMFLDIVKPGMNEHIMISLDRINKNLSLMPEVEQDIAGQTIMAFVVNCLPTSTTRLNIAQTVADSVLNITYAHLTYSTIVGESRLYTVYNAFCCKLVRATSPVTAFFHFIDCIRDPITPNIHQAKLIRDCISQVQESWGSQIVAFDETCFVQDEFGNATVLPALKMIQHLGLSMASIVGKSKPITKSPSCRKLWLIGVEPERE